MAVKQKNQVSQPTTAVLDSVSDKWMCLQKWTVSVCWQMFHSLVFYWKMTSEWCEVIRSHARVSPNLSLESYIQQKVIHSVIFSQINPLIILSIVLI